MTAHVLDLRLIRAILFDVDGTLYAQQPLRCRMVYELVKSFCRSPLETLATTRYLQAFRRERETLRDVDPGCELELWQYRLPSEKYGLDEKRLRVVVADWIHQRPLRYLKGCRRDDLDTFLLAARQHGVKLGTYSDYPAAAKVAALGLADHFDLHLCSTEPQINRFKPAPNGILAACDHWQVEPGSLLYIGDRAAVDGAASDAAGCHFLLIGQRGPDKYPAAKSYSFLYD